MDSQTVQPSMLILKALIIQAQCVEVSKITGVQMELAFLVKGSTKIDMFLWIFAALYILRNFVINPKKILQSRLCSYHQVDDVCC